MGSRLIICAILCVTVCELVGQNVLISSANKPNEPSIIMDTNHPNFLVAGANLNNYYFSSDTGRTWQEGSLKSSYGVWGDPTIGIDGNGDFYFFHLSNPASGNWIDRIVCQKSKDHGMTWSDGSFTGLNGDKDQDKQWVAMDRSNGNIYLTWTQFDEYGSTDPSHFSNIMFSKSKDGGTSWSAAKQINKKAGDCLDSDNTVEGAVPAVGLNGEIFVSWAGPDGIVFNRSKDQGETWLGKEIHVADIPGGWDFAIPGISRANGLPITVCDLSQGPNRGTIYINWSDQTNGTEDTDIWLSKSKDGGNTWSPPIRVNDDFTNKQQFFTWMAIDQTSGNLYFVFYDRRNYADENTDVYMAVSKDGGTTFANRKISETPFLPNEGVFFGDYTNITAHDGIVRPIWTRLHNGQLSIWTDITNLDKIVSSVSNDKKSDYALSFENYPNPSDNTVFVSFKLHEKAVINLNVLDKKGKLVAKVISNEIRNYGKYIERIELDALKVPSGIYFLQLKVGEKTKTTEQIIVK